MEVRFFNMSFLGFFPSSYFHRKSCNFAITPSRKMTIAYGLNLILFGSAPPMLPSYSVTLSFQQFSVLVDKRCRFFVTHWLVYFGKTFRQTRNPSSVQELSETSCPNLQVSDKKTLFIAYVISWLHLINSVLCLQPNTFYSYLVWHCATLFSLN